MFRGLVVSKNEESFIKTALETGKRTDGRGLIDMRPVEVSYDSDFGPVHVSLGCTKVVAIVSAEIACPREESPTDGIVVFNTEFSPMCSPSVQFGRITDEEVFVSRMLDKTLRRSRAIDTESLCVIAGRNVWCIKVDIRVLDNCGNVVDCASIAAIAALLRFKRPEVSVVNNLVVVHKLDERVPVPLKIINPPFCISFAFFNDGDTIIIDPDLFEFSLSQGQVTIAANIHRELCAINMSGGCPLAPEQIVKCTRIACEKAREIYSFF